MGDGDLKVQIGGDRVIPDSPNWAAMSHQQLYDAVHHGNSPSDAHGLAREWTALGEEMSESSRALGERVRGTESGWQGEAAEAARRAISELVSWNETAAATSSQMAGRIADQAQIAEQAKANMPEPVQFNAAQELASAASTGGIFGLIAASADLKHKSDQAQSAHGDAVHVMQTMESDSRHVDGNTPRFAPPPEVIKESPADTGSQSPTPGLRRLHRLTPTTGGLTAREQPQVGPHAVGTASAGASPDAVTPVGDPGSPAEGAPDGDTPDSAAAMAAASGGGVPGAALGGGTSSTGGSYGDSGTVKFSPVGSPTGGPPAASTSSAGYTPPPPVISPAWNAPSGSPPATPDGPVGGATQGWQPAMPGAGTGSGGPSSGRSGSANRNQNQADQNQQAVSNAMRDPNYWAHQMGSGAGDGSTDGPSDGPLAGPPGDPLSQPGKDGLPGSTSPSGAAGGTPPRPDTGGLPGGTGLSGLGSTAGAGVGHMTGGGFTSMSGQLPPVGATGTVPDANHAAMAGGAPGASSAGAPAAQGGGGMGSMGGGGMGRQGGQDKERKSPGYVTGEKIVEEPERVAPSVIGVTFKKMRPQRDSGEHGDRT